MSNVSYFPNINQPMMNSQMGPYQASQASQSFYSGPGYPAMNEINSDLENRVSRLERQINRMDARLTKLEGNNNIIDDNNSYTSNMYIV